MKQIWKVGIPELNSLAGSAYPFSVSMPRGAKLIHIGYQQSRPQMWFEVNPEAENVGHPFLSVGTGHGVVPEGTEYVGTVQDGGMVWHIYQPKA